MHRRRDLERSSWNCVKKTRLWLDVYVLPSLENLQLSLKNSMLFKSCCPSSDSYPRTTRTHAVFSASSHSSLWLATSQRRRTEFTPLVHFLTLVRTRVGRCACVLPETSPSSLSLSAAILQTTTLSRHSTCSWTTTSPKWRTLLWSACARVSRIWALRRSATSFYPRCSLLSVMARLHSRLELVLLFARWHPWLAKTIAFQLSCLSFKNS